MGAAMQFRIGYSMQEDRVLLCIAAADGTEVKLWLTRRMTLRFCTVARKFATETAHGRSDTVRRHVSAFERAAAAEQSDRQSQYRGGTPHPTYGEQPRLAVKASLTPKEGGEIALQFVVDGGTGISFSLDRSSFLAFWDLLDSIVHGKTGWYGDALDSFTIENPAQQSAVLH